MNAKHKTVFVAFSSQKGGVGKSTFTSLIASIMHYKLEYNVAVFDADFPQHSLVKMKNRDLVMVMENETLKKMAYRQFSAIDKKAYPILPCKADTVLQAADDFIKNSQVPLDIIFFDLPGTVNTPGILKALAGMNHIFTPITADRVVVESTLVFTQLLKDVIMKKGETSIKTINLFWNQVDRRESTPLYNVYDLGSEYLSAGKADGVDNVLRIKAAVQNFEPETNFSVITEDGSFYNFDVFYSSAPAVLTYDLLKMKQTEQQKVSEALFDEIEGYSPSAAGLIMESIYHRGKKIIRNINSDNYGIAFYLKGIYVHQGKLYFHTALNNKSNLPFIIDAVTFSIVDKKKAKKTILQDQTLTPLRIYKVLYKVPESSEESNVFMLEQFTLIKDKLLIIEIFEKNGERNQLLKVKSSAIIKPEVIMF